MYLVRDHQRDLPEPVRLVPEQRVGLLRGGDDDVIGLQARIGRVEVADRDAHLDPEWLELPQVVVLLRGQRPQRHDVEDLAVAFQYVLHRGQVGDQGLARGGGHGQDQVLSGHRHRGGLRLGRIELGDAVLFQDLDDPCRNV